MIHTQIGETAGRIWHTLDDEGEVRLSLLQKQIDVPQAMLYMALGWLAREDKVAMERDGRSLRVRLK